jgi:uncharacterized lipoprotein
MRIGLLSALLALGASGCALTSENVDLAYVPQTGVVAQAGARDVAVDVKVADQRPDKSRKVSSKKNGFGMETAPILANEDVTVTVRRAMEQELQARGFTLGGDAAVSVAADLIRLWNDHKMGFFSGDAMAEMQMSVAVKDRGGRGVYSRLIQVQGAETNTMLATGNNARLALNDALAKCMKALFDDPAFTAALIEASKTTSP